MTGLIQLPAKLWRLSAEQKLWLMPIYLLSLPAWLLTLLIPGRRLGFLLGTSYRNIELSVLADEKQQLRAWRLGRLVEAVCKYTPWPSKCLVQAMVTRFILCCYGIPHVIYIGICKPVETGHPMPSHAWLCVDRWVVTGRDGHRAFKVIASYVSPGSIVAPVLPNTE